ncbi:hypothetical protein DRE_00420 [Drechslerella stenobrocha 248]|uniref:Methyltransferase type 11 domain-containing protein n=1 Tax=Drechslerella stenobrocha 248 TaxID=1043628 RepID=W7I4S4_9PEZI|nr:hypothetical protein DRE_00420 [Drechslerella stenobrocha 248]
MSSQTSEMAAIAANFPGAEAYEKLTGGWPARISKTIISELPLPITADSVILDNCCGSGAITTAAVNFCQEKGFMAKIHATDLSPGMAGHVASLHKDVPEVQAVPMDAQELKFPDNTFTHVICAFGVFFCPDYDLGYREMYRVAAPGSVTVITSWKIVGWEPTINYIIQKIRPGQKAFRLPAPPGFQDKDWVKERMEKAGWKNVAVREIPDYTRAQGDIASGMFPLIQSVIEGWTDEEKQRFVGLFDEAAEACGVEKFPDGWWKIEMVALAATGTK